MNRRNILIGSGMVALLSTTAPLAALAGQQLAAAVDLAEDENIVGSPDSPITIVEYASMTCPHCASFHRDVYPQLKAAWIDTGKARMVFRHFPLDALALRASALAECLEGDQFFGFLDLLFATQPQWSRAPDPLGALQGIAKQAGLNEEASNACLNDESVLRAILLQRQEAAEKFAINSTPSFVVNGETLSGALGFDRFDSHLQDLYEDLT